MSEESQGLHPTAARSLGYARIAGYVMSALLLLIGLGSLIRLEGTFEAFKGGYFVLYGIVLSLPYMRMSDRLWRVGFVALVVLSAFFVFVMVAVVMFNYMAAADRGEKLGVPGFEGTLIFLALLQVPVVLFQRKPDLMD